MNQKTRFALWGGMFILCAALGFIPEPAGAVKWLLAVLAVLCFLPPLAILRNARQKQDRDTLRLLRNLSAASLSLTVVLLMANFASFAFSEKVGDLLYVMLVIVSSPMICGGWWLLSLFLWASLLIASVNAMKKDG